MFEAHTIPPDRACRACVPRPIEESAPGSHVPSIGIAPQPPSPIGVDQAPPAAPLPPPDVTGLDHLLAYHGREVTREVESELRTACFMGLVSFLADRPEVLRVSPLQMPDTFNAVARAVIQSADTERTPLSDAGLDGTGEVVQVRWCRRWCWSTALGISLDESELQEARLRRCGIRYVPASYHRHLVLKCF